MKRSFRDDEGFLRVLREHHDDLARFARALTRHTEDAKDLVADTILKAFESWNAMREPTAMKTYLFRIAHRIHIRQQQRKRFFATWINGALDNGARNSEVEHISSEPLPDRLTDATIVREALLRLPPAQQEILVLVDVLGWSIEEVITIHGGTAAGTKSALHRSRQQLKKLLHEGGRNDKQ